jgi:hypothetical protein
MPQPIVICLEDLDADDLSRTYMQCSVLVGDASGLRLDAGGEVRWNLDEPLLELCVSRDDQLIVFVPAEANLTAVLSRAGRSLTIPAEKPVVALDGDVLAVSGRRYRIHVHGAAPWSATPPRWLTPKELGVEPEEPQLFKRGAAKKAATALAMAAALGMGAVGCKNKNEVREKMIEVRDSPPKMTPPKPESAKSDARPTKADQDEAATGDKVSTDKSEPSVKESPKILRRGKPTLKIKKSGDTESVPQLDRKGDD